MKLYKILTKDTNGYRSVFAANKYPNINLINTPNAFFFSDKKEAIHSFNILIWRAALNSWNRNCVYSLIEYKSLAPVRQIKEVCWTMDDIETFWKLKRNKKSTKHLQLFVPPKSTVICDRAKLTQIIYDCL